MIPRFFSSLTNKILVGIIAALALVAGVQTFRLLSVKAAYSDYRATMDKIAREGVEKARVGDASAVEAAKATVTAIEAENARAVEAASNSDDPLKAALDAL